MTAPDTLLIRADADARMGTGHVMRCLALAQAWQDTGGSVSFISASMPSGLKDRLTGEGISVTPLGASAGGEDDARECIAEAQTRSAEWVVVDGYQFGSDYQRWLKAAGLRVLFVDDYGHGSPYTADLVLNQNLHAQESLYLQRASDTRLLLGPRYALLRREFRRWLGFQQTIRPIARNILVTMGGSDPDNVTLKVIDALARLEELEVRVVVGAGNPHMAVLQAAAKSSNGTVHLLDNVTDMPGLMTWADLAVSAAGSTCWELAMSGVPMILLVLASNQQGIAAELQKCGAASSLGWYYEVSTECIRRGVGCLLASQETRQTQSQIGRALVDRSGACRVSAALRGRLKITIASDRDSWINPFLIQLANEIRLAGHDVVHVHTSDQIRAGDICFLLSFWSCVTEQVLARNTHNLVVHESDLPQGRGWSPLTWQVLGSKNTIPVVLFEATKAVDSGSVYLRETISLRGSELLGQLRERQAMVTRELCLRFINEYPFIASTGRCQTGQPSSYRRRTPADSRLDPNRTIAEQFNLLRVVDNDRYPAFFEIGGTRYVIRISIDDSQA